MHERAENAWRGPIFDPERLKTESGRKELTQLARAYYQTTHDAIRRCDPHHLILGDRYEANDGEWYADVLAALFDNPGCIGFHLCGAYQRNKARRRGLLDELERPDQENVELISAANAKVGRWMDEW